MADDVLSMRFDQYQRYRLVADVLERLRAGGARLRILDVGGRTALLRRFLPDPITLLDMEPSQEAGLVLGSGSRMPFAAGSFDVVAAFDTLEHVPAGQRQAFVAECARVARRYVLLAGPYEHPRVVESEELLQRFLDQKLGVAVRHLDEHRQHGLPERDEVEAQLEGLGAKVLSIPHGNLDRWLACQCVGFYLDWDQALHGLAEAFHRYYNRELYARDHAEPVYRHVVLAALEGAPLPDPAGLLGPATAPDGTLGPFTEMATELMAFDRERERWRGERQRLLDDREGQLGALETLSGELEATRAALGSMEAEYRRTLAALRELQARPHAEGSRWASLKRALRPRRPR